MPIEPLHCKTGLMIITCPHCQTKYQVTYDAVGSAGRKVQCAHCSRAWQQAPVPAAPPSPAEREDNDRLFDSMAEDALDEVLLSEEKQVQAERGLPERRRDRLRPDEAGSDPAPAPADPVELRRRQQAFSRRQSELVSRLPLARLRRTARIVGVVILLAMAMTAYFGRVQLVERYPALAGLYEAVGLGVNVVGLQFSSLQSLKTTSGGQESLAVSAQIVGLAGRPVRVPPVIISLLDAHGATVYEWSVDSRVPDLMAGERATFETRLTTPPPEAVRVRLSFTTGANPAGPTMPTLVRAAPDSTETTPPATGPVHGAPAEHH